MNIISEYKIRIDRERNIGFVVDSTSDFKCHGVSLFNMSIFRMYGNTNFLISNNDYINYLSNLMSNRDYQIFNDDGIPISYDFCWQHEIYVEILSDCVYIEKWGLCTKIKLEEFIEVFNDIQHFLKRWKSKGVLISQIKDAFTLKDSKEARELFFIKTESEINNDQIQLMLNESDFEMDINEYIKTLNFPVHMV